MYPSIILQNNLFPAHLGKAFLNVYRRIYDQRVSAKKEGRKVENETLKLALNGLTGNLQSQYSWVYDPVMAFKILSWNMMNLKDFINTQSMTILV